MRPSAETESYFSVFRISGEYRRAIAEIVSGSLKDRCPDLKGLISVTKADVSSDLKNAKVFVSIFDGDPAVVERSFSILKENAGFVRRELAHTMQMRTVPEVRFVLDTSMAYGSKIDELIKKIHKDEDDE